MNSNVPTAPDPEVIIETSTENLSKWIAYFKGLSKRLRVVSPDKEDFVSLLSTIREHTVIISRLDPLLNQCLHGWPEPDEVAFIVLINSASPNRPPQFKTEDARIFCFGNVAFKPRYFEWDGDGEEDPNCKTYSLRNFRESCLYWSFITESIKKDLEEFNEYVPEVPIK